MSSFENEGAALDAAAAAFQAENGGQPSVPESSPQPAQGTPEPPAPSATEPEGFTNINPDDLPPELQQVYKSMQADYTRKTQEVAPWRKLQEAGVDFETAQQSVQFLYELNNNPEFQRAVYERLAQGFAPEDAAAIAADDVQQGAIGDDEDDGYLAPADRQMLNELRQWKQDMEEERELMMLESQLVQQETALRQANPSWTDQDFARVRRIGFSTGGDLAAAAAEYANWRNEILSGYVEQKGSVVNPATNLPATGSSQEPQKFESVEDAHRAAVALVEGIEGFDEIFR